MSALCVSLSLCACCCAAAVLPDTAPLTWEGGLGLRMVAGIDAYLTRATEEIGARRHEQWRRDTSSAEAYEASVAPNRERLRTLLGVVNTRVPVEMLPDATLDRPALVGTGTGYTIHAVRWPVREGVHGEGLLLEPEQPPQASVVALPDCDWTPEMLVGLEAGVPEAAQYARRLAESGCRVLVPLLINRDHTHSGNPAFRMLNEAHREFLMRMAFHMGRHIIGYEIEKVLAAIDWLAARYADRPEHSVGVFGYGEGGLIALYAAALDTRIAAAAVSGYFGPREGLWEEPIYRSVWALLTEFGDAEVASLIAPRTLVVEAARHPEGVEPRKAKARTAAGAPGRIVTPSIEAVRGECARARKLLEGLTPPWTPGLVQPPEELPGGDETLTRFLDGLGVGSLYPETELPRILGSPVNAAARLKRQFDELVAYTQGLMREAATVREVFWNTADATSLDAWEASMPPYRDYLWEEVLGKLPPPTFPMNPRSREVFDEPAYRGYEIVLDVYPDVFAYGILLVPKEFAPGERRPVVVCQHGLEGTPRKVADPGQHDPAYNQYGCRLAERGFIVFAPQNPYIGGNAFRQLQRKAHPLKLSLFSFIVRQHERILEWLRALPNVDPDRIGFYGISYGGKTALRAPALLDGYKVVICSADFNEWIWKVATVDAPFGYMFTHEYEMLEWDLAHTFNHAEMSWMILPRPFMVERGHHDGVSIDEWVAYEYARTRRQYARLGIG
ncbi:MAG TPA: dienelactone hydrolase family protein, partial [Candidatus Hydrogenedentes bacterium]|nr:dienelactone hydrolase family protein [Candidatus Hydrogenedentota bacterium]